LTEQERPLSRQLVAAWTNFMYAGNPNLKGDSPWPRYTGDAKVYLSQNLPHVSAISEAQFRAAHKCDFWDTVLIF
jgi:para-nitrobenzyl esterase